MIFRDAGESSSEYGEHFLCNTYKTLAVQHPQKEEQARTAPLSLAYLQPVDHLHRTSPALLHKSLLYEVGQEELGTIGHLQPEVYEHAA